MNLAPLKALFQMASATEAPTLDEPHLFSASYISFIAECLQRDPSKRPSASDLRKHPLIAGAGDRSLLQAYLENRYRFQKGGLSNSVRRSALFLFISIVSMHVHV